MEINYCLQCGESLSLKSVGDEGLAKYCVKCHKYFFDNPVSCVLVTIVNEKQQVLLLKQNYITTDKWTLCSGYLKKGDTLEETVAREVFEETGLTIVDCQYVRSYYYKPKNLIMTGYIARVNSDTITAVSKEVDDMKWVELDKAAVMLARENNYSGTHFDLCKKVLQGNNYSIDRINSKLS